MMMMRRRRRGEGMDDNGVKKGGDKVDVTNNS